MPEITIKTFEQPDQVRTIPRMIGQLIRMGPVAVGRGARARVALLDGPGTGDG